MWTERLAQRVPDSSLESRARVRFVIGGMSLMQGDMPAAREAVHACVPMFRDLGDRTRLAQALIFVGMAEDALGDPERAVSLYAATQRAQNLTAIRHTLGAARFEVVWSAGRGMSLDRCVEAALS